MPQCSALYAWYAKELDENVRPSQHETLAARCHAVTPVLVHLGLMVLTERAIRAHTGATFVGVHQPRGKNTHDGVGRGVKGNQWIENARGADFIVVQRGESISHQRSVGVDLGDEGIHWVEGTSQSRCH